MSSFVPVVVIEVRSCPSLLVYIVETIDDPVERRHLALLGTWEMRIGGGDWRPLYLEDKN
jgi:hypothetical protein